MPGQPASAVERPPREAPVEDPVDGLEIVSRRPLVVKMPVDVRSASLTVLTVVVCLAALHVAAELIVPVVLAALAAYALDPAVRALERLALPRWLAAAMVVTGFVGVLGTAAYQLADEAETALNRLPEVTERLRRELRELRNGASGPMKAIEAAADDLEAAASEAAGGQTPRARPAGEPALRLRESIVIGYVSLIGFAGQVILLLFFVYFLLASGDLFKRKLVRLAGPALSKRRVTVEMIDEINRSIERFILVILATNAFVALLTWLAFLWIGLENAGAWALLGGALNTIPYFGSAAAAAIYLIVGLLQFGDLGHAAGTAALFLVITGLEGMLLKPCLMSRSASMNNVAVFLGLLFWGWLWGVWGMLLAFPIMMVIKTVSDHVNALRPVGELLAD